MFGFIILFYTSEIDWLFLYVCFVCLCVCLCLDLPREVDASLCGWIEMVSNLVDGWDG